MTTDPEARIVRDRLSQVIVEVVASWPERDRRIFAAVHYEARPVEEAARSAGVDPAAASLVLESCERLLYEALREFRLREAPAAHFQTALHSIARAS